MKYYDFPTIEYPLNKTPKDWGLIHGESFATGIAELAKIRKELLLQRSPKIGNLLDELAKEQLAFTSKYCPYLAEELISISKGANVSIEDIIILNNYTDFRDITIKEQGCSTFYCHQNDNILFGQTWDMHKSAKNYICIIKVPAYKNNPASIIFSLVGCLGMMGINTYNLCIGVNNLNSKNAQTSIIWPAIIRSLLFNSSKENAIEKLKKISHGSGRNYTIVDKTGGENWEVTSSEIQKVASLEIPKMGTIFHTNHCLGEKTKLFEEKNNISITSHNRYELLFKKQKEVIDLDSLYSILTDHYKYPKSICSHYGTHSTDPSVTCGGVVFDLKAKIIRFWRGCPKYDKNFKKLDFSIIGDTIN